MPGRPAQAMPKRRFVGAMVYNLGKLLTAYQVPDEAEAIRALWRQPRLAGRAADGRVHADVLADRAASSVSGLGFEALGVGVGVGRHWGLPESMQRCMRRPHSAPPHQRLPARPDRHPGRCQTPPQPGVAHGAGDHVPGAAVPACGVVPARPGPQPPDRPFWPGWPGGGTAPAVPVAAAGGGGADARPDQRCVPARPRHLDCRPPSARRGAAPAGLVPPASGHAVVFWCCRCS